MSTPISGNSGLPNAAELVSRARVETLRSAQGAQSEVAAEDLEALFATLLVKELRRALPEGFFGKGPGADTYEAWLDEHLGRALAEDGALDLAGRVKSALDAKQAGAGPAGHGTSAGGGQ